MPPVCRNPWAALWWRGVHATPLWGSLPTSCRGKSACWGTFSKEQEPRRTAPHRVQHDVAKCLPQRRTDAPLGQTHGQVRRFELLFAFIFAPFCCSPMRREEYSHQNQNRCNPQGKSEHTNRSASPVDALHA